MTKHRWEKVPTHLAASETADGNARTERTCMFCGLVKITVHPAQGFPWREWRTRHGGVMIGARVPQCVTIDADEKAAA
jgi:hypothetical protein